MATTAAMVGLPGGSAPAGRAVTGSGRVQTVALEDGAGRSSGMVAEAETALPRLRLGALAPAAAPGAMRAAFPS